jgi:hypothetical protein
VTSWLGTGKPLTFFYSVHVNLVARLLKPGSPSIGPLKKENKIFLIYNEIQIGSGAKSFMRKGFPNI